LGDTEILRMGDEMRESLGNRFDIRDFHDDVLKPGGLSECPNNDTSDLQRDPISALGLILLAPKRRSLFEASSPAFRFSGF
jgi:hypothetical protein